MKGLCSTRAAQTLWGELSAQDDNKPFMGTLQQPIVLPYTSHLSLMLSLGGHQDRYLSPFGVRQLGLNSDCLPGPAA